MLEKIYAYTTLRSYLTEQIKYSHVMNSVLRYRRRGIGELGPRARGGKHRGGNPDTFLWNPRHNCELYPAHATFPILLVEMHTGPVSHTDTTQIPLVAWNTYLLAFVCMLVLGLNLKP